MLADRPRRRPLGGMAFVLLTALAVLLTGAAVVLVTPTAEAVNYRYWSYWKSSGAQWTYASGGPSGKPADGALEGWRFAVGVSGSSVPPRGATDFAAICGGHTAGAGEKRVAVVVDFGTASDAPPAESPPAGVTTRCAVVPTGANGYQVLDSVYRFRSAASGLICGINGYPARECGAPVSEAAPTPTTPPPSTAAAPGAPRPSAAPTSSAPASTGSPSEGPAPGSAPRDPAASPGPEETVESSAPPEASSTTSSSPTPPASLESGGDAGANALADPAAASATPPSTSTGNLILLAVAVLGALALAVAAVLRSRRHRPGPS